MIVEKEKAKRNHICTLPVQRKPLSLASFTNCRHISTHLWISNHYLLHTISYTRYFI